MSVARGGSTDVDLTFATTLENRVLVTEFIGTVTDDDLVAYHERLVVEERLDAQPGGLIDGRRITSMQVTRDGIIHLASLVRDQAHLLRGQHLAMVATSDIVYGMFRMWELERGDLDYQVRVFRDYGAALIWLKESIQAKEDADHKTLSGEA